jgi:SAM-dependent methyltransferase
VKHRTLDGDNTHLMDKLDNQVEYWDRVGPTKPFSHPVNWRRLGSLLTHHSSILDLGCGYGRTLADLSQNSYRHLIGADAAPAMIAAARRRVPAAAFSIVRLPDLPLPDESIDAVLLFAVLTCIPTDDGQRALIREATRVLRAGGLLYISDLWLQPDTRNLQRYDRDRAKYGVYGVFELPEGVVLRHHDRRWIDDLTGGLVRVALDEIRIQTMNGHNAAGFQWFGRKPSPPNPAPKLAGATSMEHI